MDILLEMMRDQEMKPRGLPFHLIQDITNNFAVDNKIGSGGCAVVYKGILQNGEEIAVKKPFSKHENRDAFMDELQNLLNVKHQNIVRFIGYSYEAWSEHENIEGKDEMVASWERLLCFEYAHNGSLDNYLLGKSQALDWDACYKIIRGVCDGLKYLHEIPMYHLDLKPQNILLDKYMMPKIADFGLSRLSDKNFRTIHTSTIAGTLAYMAPEVRGGTITDKVDIYSLGVIIIQMIVGYEDCPKRHEMPLQEFKKLVKDKLFDMVKAMRFQNSTILENKICNLLEVYREQGWKCFETALKCIDTNRHNRPTIHDVVNVLNQTENMIQKVLKLIRFDITDILDIHPMELRFVPFNENDSIYCPLHITNKTDYFIGYFIFVRNLERYRIIGDGSKGIVGRKSTCILIVEMRKQEQQSQRRKLEIDVLDILFISMENQQDLIHIMDETIVEHGIQESYLFQEVRAKEGKVHGWVALTAILCAPERRKYELTDDKNNIAYEDSFCNWRSICVHPTARWMLAIDNSGDVIVWKHESIKHSLPFHATKPFKLDVTKPHILYSLLCMIGLSYCNKVVVTSAKFFVQRPWIVCGDEKGDIHVYNFIIRIKVKQFGAHRAKITSLAVHPTQSLVLSACQDGIIKLWDSEKIEWKCTRHFTASLGDWCNHLTFNPNDNVTFAAGFVRSIVKVWNINYVTPSCTLPVSKFDSTSPFVSGDKQHLITRDNKNIHIWDWQTGRCVKQLTLCMMDDINTIACHPSHPIIVACSPSNTIAILNATTFRLEDIVGVLLYPIQELGFINSVGFTSLVMICKEGIHTDTLEAPEIISQRVGSL